MNLHELVRRAITAVAPDRTVYRLPSLGQTTGPDYQVLPVYGPCEAVTAQVQPVADKTPQWLVQSRQNSIWRDLYVSGLSAGLDRAEALGGDLYYFDGAEWQVDQVLEDWRAVGGPGWTKVRVCKVRAVGAPALGATTPPPQDLPGVDGAVPLTRGTETANG